ncbi:MAG: cellobiose phosphorylase [Methylocystis sp.]|nr:MAG: cellobiose phosphorylase [Methylocystis sp.]PWB90107.1 cellobiose phosphorylase [Methylocystis sp. MitZ-2018]
MPIESMRTPRQDDLGLLRIVNELGLSISVQPNGAIFAMQHGRILINHSLASPIAGGMTRFYLRLGGIEPRLLPIIGPEAGCRIGAAHDRFVWEGETSGISHRVALWLHPGMNLWLWRVELISKRRRTLPCDAVFIQDLGLGDHRFLMSNEAYACQYLDHYVARHPRMNYVLMGRQNLSQYGIHPWVAHGCVEGAINFATDFRQLMGPAWRDADQLDCPFGASLPSYRLQGETACAALQSEAVTLASGATASWTFFGLYRSDHPAASTDADLALSDDVERISKEWAPGPIPLSNPTRSLLQDAPVVVADPLNEATIEARYPRRTHVERAGGQILSFFTPGKTYSRHIVLRDKERLVLRRHGALLRSGAGMLPNEEALCVTCWMHGVFGAQLTIGNTSFHQLFSVSRDPYNVTRGNGVRMLVNTGDGWRLLTVPSAFEMGFNDCRWIYRVSDRTIIVSAIVSSEEAAVQWCVTVEGERCRFLVFGHLTLGEREFAHSGRIEIDASQKQFSFRPDLDDKWGQHYPQAVFHLVTSTPESVEIVGSDELLYADGKRRSGGFASLRTWPTNKFTFAVVGSMKDAKQAKLLAAKYARHVDRAAMLGHAARYWRNITRGIRVKSSSADTDAKAIDTILPWLAHDAMVHLTVPHGLEQYMGAAWGTRDVCQGPIELLLSLEHDEAAKDILRIIFAQQYEQQGDWPQWFMLEPYSAIQDREAHGDVIVWPLKALCDYLEATGDFSFLGEPVAWRREDSLKETAHADPIAAHVEILIATARRRFIAGTCLIRYGGGDWNDSLQLVDPSHRDRMVSSWTVALLYQQFRRYAEILRRVGRSDKAEEQDSLASAMREDFNRFLIRDGAVAGYGLFRSEGGLPELLLHPSDIQTGISYSLLPMTQAIIGRLFTPEQARHHFGLIRKHLAFSDGVRLMDKPMTYHGGLEKIFQRAESAAFFGREIGLMYVHSHLRYAEAMAALGEFQALWDALVVVNPIAVTDRLPQASLRQRNAYFSSSDAAFRDRYQASAEWERLKAETIAVDGGWRIYSSGPGLYINLLIREVFGVRRRFGKRLVEPRLPPSRESLRLDWPSRLP